MMLSRNKLLPAIVTASLFGTCAATSSVHAGGHEEAENKDAAQAASPSQELKKSAEQVANETKDAAHGYGQEMQAAVQDAWLNGKLDTALLFTREVDSFAIDTEIKNGVAHLTGSVDSDIQRDLAEEIAQSVDGVESVRNELKVVEGKAKSGEQKTEMTADESFRSAVENAALTARIKSELLINTNVSGLSVDVDSSGNAVTLNGSVSSEASKELVEQIAQNAAGKRDVRNNLRVEANS